MSEQLFRLPPAPAATNGVAWLDGRVEHLSASSLRMLKICPEQWRNRYILGRKERPGEALVLGSAFHDAVGYSLQQKIVTHLDLPTAEVVDYYHDLAWPKAVADDGGEDEIRWDSKPDVPRADGERITRAYHGTVAPRLQPLQLERRIELSVPGVPVPVIGYVDIEEDGNLVDVKSGKQVSRKPDANWRTQGSIYSATLGKPTHFHSVSRAKTTAIATPLESDLMVVNPNPAQTEQLRQLLVDFSAQLEWYYRRFGPDEHWPLTGQLMDLKGGAACSYCGFRPTCPAWAHEH